MSNQTDAGGGKGHRIDIFSEFRVGDKTIQRDEPGYLVNPEDLGQGRCQRDCSRGRC